MSTPGGHHKHASMTNRMIERDGNSAMLSFEVEGLGGAKTLVKIKSTSFAPVGRTLEYSRGAARRFKGHIVLRSEGSKNRGDSRG